MPKTFVQYRHESEKKKKEKENPSEDKDSRSGVTLRIQQRSKITQDAVEEVVIKMWPCPKMAFKKRMSHELTR